MERIDPKDIAVPLQEFLSNLYDPLYRIPETFGAILGCPASTVPRLLTDAIHTMAPYDIVPADAPIRRFIDCHSCGMWKA